MIAQFLNNAIKKFNNRQIYVNLEKLQLFEVTLKMRRLKACNFRLFAGQEILRIHPEHAVGKIRIQRAFRKSMPVAEDARNLHEIKGPVGSEKYARLINLPLIVAGAVQNRLQVVPAFLVRTAERHVRLNVGILTHETEDFNLPFVLPVFPHLTERLEGIF